ncbi:MAG: arginine--tRNA ligase [Pseudomonadota bacterium]
MKKELRLIIDKTLAACFENGKLTKTALPEYVVEIPNNADHGHFATNLCLTLASSQKRSPRKIAEMLIEGLKDHGAFIDKMEVAGPGFINFWINRGKWLDLLSGIILSGKDYGRSEAFKGEKVLIEYVSANPTGPLHLGHGRGAALGDTLSRILTFSGYNVVREFYINDAGVQIRLLGESIYGRWRQMSDPGAPFPEKGYHGDYVLTLADEISAVIDLGALSEEEAVRICAEKGRERMLDEIKADLSQFRASFDVWSKESDLYESGLFENSLKVLENKGQLYEKEGALWIKTSLYGDDKDRVIRKKDGQFTYFASDISYHLEKWKRGFSKAVNIWGADHHGYVQRVKAALKTNDIDGNWLSILLIQLVKLWKGGQEIKMSKRAGTYVTLRELVDEVGVDAARFVFLTKNHDSPLDFDIDLVKKHDSDNPVYYVQYAHARICSLFKKAASEGLSMPDRPDGVLERLVLEEETALIRTLSEFPSFLEDIARNYEPHRLTYYLTEVAGSFHRYFNLGIKVSENRIITPDTTLSQARLYLAEAVRNVLRNGLELLGIEAPESM